MTTPIQRIIDEIDARKPSVTGSSIGDFWVGMGLNTPLKRFAAVGGVTFAFAGLISAPGYAYVRSEQAKSQRQRKGSGMVYSTRSLDVAVVGVPLVAALLAAFVVS